MTAHPINSGGLHLTPYEILQAMISCSTGEPQETLEAIVSATPEVTTEVLNEVWSTVAYTYGSPPLIANQLLDQIDVFPYVTNTNAKVQLRKLVQLCLIIESNIPICPDLHFLNQDSGQRGIRKKLPDCMQREWQKI